jgi:hypothetical protein
VRFRCIIPTTVFPAVPALKGRADATGITNV